MAGKATHATVADNEPLHMATFRLRGVAYTDADKMPDGGLCISLEVKPLTVNWAAIADILAAGGVDSDRSKEYADKIAEKIECEEMSHFLADRLIRIG